MLIRRLLLAALLIAGIGFPVAVLAEAWQALFPEAQVVYRSDLDVENLRLALGPLKKVNNQWRAERERRASGQLQRYTLEIPETYDLEEVHQTLHEAIQQREARPLFTCSGLDCGSSSAWANNLFGIKQLYGLDQNQHYAVWEWQPEPEEVYYLTTYVVQRGNGRMYVQIDQLQVPPQEKGSIVTTPETLTQTLREQGFFELAGVRWDGEFAFDQEHVAALVSALQRDPWLNIRVVGHDYGPGGLTQQKQRSLSAAEKVRDALVKQGIKAERVSAHGVGSLAPARVRRGSRIEILQK